MILEKIVLDNFRSFYGKNEIRFSTREGAMVTTIYAANESGKTNFIDAFKWAFYGRIEGEQPEQIVNNLALAEIKDGDTISASVQLKFCHMKKRYTIEKLITEKKIDKDYSSKIDEDLKVYITNEEGETEPSRKPRAIIESILPEGMEQYFFLAGENIQQLGQEGSQDKIREAIKILMGLEIVENAKKHLKNQVRKRLRDELAQSGGVDQQEIIEKSKEIDDKIESIKTEIGTLQGNKKSLIKQLEEVEQALIAREKTRELQEKQKSLEVQSKDRKQKLEEINLAIMKKCSSDGYLAFTEKLITKVQSIIDDKRQRGIIPPSVAHTFIDDLLKMHECICGRPLVEGTEPYKKVKSQRKPESKMEYQNAINEIGSMISGIKSVHERLYDEFQKDCAYRSELLDDLSGLREQIQEIQKRFDGREYEQERDLIEKKKDLMEKREETDQDLGVKQHKLKDLKEEYEKINNELVKAKSLNAAHKKAKKRLQLCSHTYDFLERLHNSLIHRDRKMLCKRINNIFKEIVGNREDAMIELNEDFDMTVKVKQYDGGVKILPKGGAESQITCLSFIASIVSIAEGNVKDDSNIFSRGGIYPIVLDSPFGVMDHDYRNRVAQKLPEFAKQIVILVAPQQWDKGMEAELLPHIGNMYKFHRYFPDQREEITIKVNGISHILSEYVDGRARTNIEEIGKK